MKDSKEKICGHCDDMSKKIMITFSGEAEVLQRNFIKKKFHQEFWSEKNDERSFVVFCYPS